MKTWQTTRHKHFQHSFGGSSGGCGLQLGHTPHEEPECEYEGDRREAVAAMVAALSTVAAEEGQPISLFHVRDALTVRDPLIKKLMVNVAYYFILSAQQIQYSCAFSAVMCHGASSGQDVAPRAGGRETETRGGAVAEKQNSIAATTTN